MQKNRYQPTAAMWCGLESSGTLGELWSTATEQALLQTSEHKDNNHLTAF